MMAGTRSNAASSPSIRDREAPAKIALAAELVCEGDEPETGKLGVGEVPLGLS